MQHGKSVVIYVPRDEEIHKKKESVEKSLFEYEKKMDFLSRKIKLLEEAAAPYKKTLGELLVLNRLPETDLLIAFYKIQTQIDLNKKVVDQIKKEYQPLKERYDRYVLLEQRADTFLRRHPLSMTAELETGIMKGSYVVRNINQAAQIVRGILLENLEYRLVESKNAYMLVENITGSIVRVASKDSSVRNAFWKQWAADQRME